MGSHVFTWPRPAEEVYVTGTFDDWGKTVKLERKGDTFAKEVHLSKVDEKIYYKFVVDGNWTTDHGQSQESDSGGNVNNVLKPEDFATSGPTERKSSPPGAYPETPANEINEYMAKPIPATEGSGNPVQLNPGEKVPEHTGDVNSTVTTSKEDYEKAGSVALPVAAGAVGAAAVAGSSHEKNMSLPERSRNMIPESSLPVEAANPTVQSAGAGTTTSELAGQVPLEPKREAKVLDGVPEVVKESIAESKQGPEATSNPEAVEEKKEVEAELLKEIKKTNETGEPAPKASSSVYAQTTAAAVPETVKESIAESKQGPEAAASSEAVKEKSQVEAELLKEIKPTNATGEPAPTAAAATSETAPAPTTSAPTTSAPTTSAPTTTTQETPEVTTGVDSSKTEVKSTPETPSKSTAADTPASSTQTTPASMTAEEKKKKRKSIFGKLKEKFK